MADEDDKRRHATMLVCGGHDYTDKDRLWATLNELLNNRGVVRVIELPALPLLSK
jgi:hypothetical protein